MEEENSQNQEEAGSGSQELQPQRQQQQQQQKSNQTQEAEPASTRSRSQSRRNRRKRIRQQIDDGEYLKTAPLEAVEEAEDSGELTSMQPFERIGPDSTSMDGPVTYERAKRGEIPVRGSNPNQPKYMTPSKDDSGDNPDALKDQDGLKLSLEANLHIELELKASIRGDLTLSLLE